MPDLIVTGEIILGMDDAPEQYFEPVAPALRAADVVFGHLEAMHTLNPMPAWDNRLPAKDPELLRGVVAGNFSALSLAGNPTYTYGPPGVADTIAWLDKHGVAHTGAGMDIDEATQPAIVERDGVRFGFLAYDCVGVDTNAATTLKPGAAYVDVITHYVPSRLAGGPAKVYTWAERWSLQAACEEIAALRAKCDVVCVAFHMGLVGSEIELADYEAQIAYAAIDAGADAILGYHAHVLKGIEFYKGKPIFHCLGNFVTVFPWDAHLAYRQTKTTTRMRSKTREWPGQTGRQNIDPEYPLYPFPASSRNAMLVKFGVNASGGLERLSYLPCMINKKGQPELVGKSALGQQVFDYVEKVTRAYELNASFAWDGDEVLIIGG